MLKNLVPTVIAWVGVVIVLALAPTIETYNGHVTTNVSGMTNSSYAIGMTAIDDFGGFIMILLLLLGTGLFAYGAAKMKSVTVMDVLSSVGSVIISVIVLAFFSGSIIGYYDSLITAGTGVAKTMYGMFVTVTYVLIIGGAGAVQTYRGVSRLRRSRKPRKAFY